MFNFLPHTASDREKMWAAIGIQSTDELFEDIPASLRNSIEYKHLPQHGLSEQELEHVMRGLARKNTGHQMACFLGGGAYVRYVPSAVNTIASRSEFYTAYTPYQPEISQGTLQVIYEFQTMISELTGLDAANASVYDGATAVAEAAMMALRICKKADLIYVANGLHPDSRDVLGTYLSAMDSVTIKEVDITSESFSQKVLEDGLGSEKPAAVIIQVPDFYGNIPKFDSIKAIQAFCVTHGAQFIVSAEPVSLGFLQPPGAYGADIVVGDIQPLGNTLSFGGPYGGYIATRQQHARQLPGRIVGKTIEKMGENTGRTCYTLTLQTREQHIRRERATSNICTNQALNVLKATVYLSLMGPQGLKELAEISMQRAHYLESRLSEIPGIQRQYANVEFFNEFVLRLPGPVKPLLKALEEAQILGGIPLDDTSLLICCTELTTLVELDRYVETVARFYGASIEHSPGYQIISAGTSTPSKAHS